jgi:hypothetical protein
MRKRNKINRKGRFNYLLLPLLLSLLACSALFLLGSKKMEAVEESHPVVPAVTVSIPIPDHVRFCGNKIALDRSDLRERFDREITSLVYSHTTTLLSLKRANRFFPVIEPLLKKNGIPDDFKYLCVVESSLDTRALSPSKAAGLWQFLDETGKRYGLEVTSEVDERYHVEKATEAACRYFREAYQKYGDWANVVISYNAGMGRISSFRRDQLSDSAFDLHLTTETSRYLFRILAIREFFENPQKYGYAVKKEHLYPVIPVHYVEVTESIDNLAVFAKENKINYMQLKDNNVWLRDTKLTVGKGKTYRIAIPEKN